MDLITLDFSIHLLMPIEVLTPVSTYTGTVITASPGSSQNLITPPPTSTFVISSTTSMVEGNPTTTKVGFGSSENDLNEDESLETTSTSWMTFEDSEPNGSSYTLISDSSDSLSTLGTTVILGDGSMVTISVDESNNDVVVDGSSLSQGQVEIIGGNTISALNEGSGIVIAQSGQTTTVNLLNPSRTNSAYISGIIFVDGSTTFTAIKSVNNKGSTVIDIIGGGTVTIDTAAITLPNGDVFSTGQNGLIIMGTGSTTSI